MVPRSPWAPDCCHTSKRHSSGRCLGRNILTTSPLQRKNSRASSTRASQSAESRAPSLPPALGTDTNTKSFTATSSGKGRVGLRRGWAANYEGHDTSACRMDAFERYDTSRVVRERVRALLVRPAARQCNARMKLAAKNAPPVLVKKSRCARLHWLAGRRLVS